MYVCAAAYELRKEFGDFVSLRDALSLECEQRSIVLPEFPRVPGWFESAPAPEELWSRRARLEVSVENASALGNSQLCDCYPRALLCRRGFERLSVIRGCVSSHVLMYFSKERLAECN